jgi:hypothetical protein
MLASSKFIVRKCEYSFGLDSVSTARMAVDPFSEGTMLKFFVSLSRSLLGPTSLLQLVLSTRVICLGEQTHFKPGLGG